MIEAGTVGARFVIEDAASPVLKKLMDQFLALQGAIDKTRLALKELRLPPGLSTSVANLDTSFTTIGTSADSMSAKVATGFGEIDAAISTTQGKLAALRGE